MALPKIKGLTIGALPSGMTPQPVKEGFEEENMSRVQSKLLTKGHLKRCSLPGPRGFRKGNVKSANSGMNIKDMGYRNEEEEGMKEGDDMNEKLVSEKIVDNSGKDLGGEKGFLQTSVLNPGLAKDNNANGSNINKEGLNGDMLGNMSRTGWDNSNGEVELSRVLIMYERDSYARVLVEVDANKGIVESVEVWYKKLGRSMELRVEYAWPSPAHIAVFLGITLRGVTFKPVFQQNNVYGMSTQMNDANFGRGGSSLKGRGGLNGRGRYGGFQSNQEKRFYVLTEEDGEDLENELMGIRVNINVAYDMGIYIDEEEKKKWPKELQKYKCNVMENNERKEKLKAKIKSLEKEIMTSNKKDFGVLYDNAYRDEITRIKDLVLKKQMTEEELFIESEQPFSDSVKKG
ncbi:hypothetical protein Tco_0806376 [Tanacetum coccineum]